MSFEKNKSYTSVNKIIYDFALSAVMLAMFLLINFLSSFLKFNFLVFDFAMVSVLVLAYRVRIRYVYLVTVLGSLFNFFYSSASWIGVMIVSVNNLIFISWCLLFIRVIFKKFFHLKRFLLINVLLSALITSLISVLLNITLFTPLYWYTYQLVRTMNFVQIANNYQPNPYLLNAPNYYAGNFALYLPFNLLKYLGVIILAMLFVRLIVYKPRVMKQTQKQDKRFSFNYYHKP
ncbi:hypothetical protein OF377_00690 [Ureaplasma sp. ES3154-GEN]|uniref:MPN527 family putative ECF transporter permease subunit n=1 Tax=Ureaplasma sp. ES3154-GEN TaxID=2984844 RepID=UPI0021E9044C|nr:hypothetical protein [Ureaplasma sp. ES3154-GEN]MCV3743404.1 hypothetical protein [Ureaplasma sp. ES3154-GEN]